MIVNPDPLRYPGSAPTTGGTSAPTGADTAAASAWLQAQPWYRQTLAAWGNPTTLTLGQRGYLARTAIQAGMDPSFGISTDGRVEDWSTNNPLFWAGVAGMGAGVGSIASANAAATSAAGASAPDYSMAPGGEWNDADVAGTADGTGTTAATSGGAAALTGKTADVVKAITALSSIYAGKKIGDASASAAVPPQLNDLLNMSVAQQQYKQPVNQAATAGMYQMLPDFAKTPQTMQGAQSLLGVK